MVFLIQTDHDAIWAEWGKQNDGDIVLLISVFTLALHGSWSKLCVGAERSHVVWYEHSKGQLYKIRGPNLLKVLKSWFINN